MPCPVQARFSHGQRALGMLRCHRTWTTPAMTTANDKLLSAEEIAAEVEAYVGSVAALVGKAAKRP